MNATNGTLNVTITDRETGATVKSLSKKLSLKRNKPVRVTVPPSMACVLALPSSIVSPYRARSR